MRPYFKLIGLFCFALSLVACNKPVTNPKALILATTTSTDNSGLLDYLLPKFEEASGIAVRIIAVGTGKALRMAQDGDVDLVMVHAKAAEEDFIIAGYGVKRVEVMVNDFVLVGPKEDPAGVRKLPEIKMVMRSIVQAGGMFVSRGDDSGTHIKELSLWQLAGDQPNIDNYRETGQGMGKTLQITDELRAYTIVDRGTWLSYRSNLALEVLYEGTLPLKNQYAAIVVNPNRYPGLNTKNAQTFIDWLISEQGQTLIGQFRVQGEVLFEPNAKG